MKFSDIKPTETFIKAVIKGVPGTRKTTQAITFPKPIFVFDVDRKIESVQLPNKLGFYGEPLDIEYEQYEKWWQVDKKLEELEGNCPYKTVIIDSVTSLGDCINRQTLGKDTTKGGKSGGKVIGGIRVNTIEDYNAETQALMRTIDAGKRLRAHFIMIAHVIMRDHKEDNRTKIIRQLVTGSKVTGAKIPAYFPEVYHFEFEDDFDANSPPHFIMYTQNHGEDFARTGLPLPYKVDITNRRLFDLISAAQKELIIPAKADKEENESW